MEPEPNAVPRPCVALRVAVAVTVSACLLAACTTTSATKPNADSAVPSGVPPEVFRAAQSTVAQPGDRIIYPVDWIKTTLGAYQRTLEASRLGGSIGVLGAPSNTPIYVVQVQGSFLLTGSANAIGPGRVPVEGVVVLIGPSASAIGTDSLQETGGGYQTDAPIDFSKLGTVHTFTMP